MQSEKFNMKHVDINEIITDISRVVDNLSRYTTKAGGTIVLIAEKYYFRIESNLAATIIIESINQSELQIVIVVAGGGHGMLGISYGAEKSMMKKIKNLFLQKLI